MATARDLDPQTAITATVDMRRCTAVDADDLGTPATERSRQRHRHVVQRMDLELHLQFITGDPMYLDMRESIPRHMDCTPDLLVTINARAKLAFAVV